MLLKNEVNPDAEAEVRDKRRNSSHGIKSAFNEDMEVSFKTQLSLEVVGRELTAVCKKSSSQTRSFLSLREKSFYLVSPILQSMTRKSFDLQWICPMVPS